MPYHILIALDDRTQPPQVWAEIAAAIAPNNAEPLLHLRGMVTVPEDQSLSEGAIAAQAWRDLLMPLSRANTAIHDEARAVVDHTPLARVLDEAKALPADLLIIQWCGAFALTGGLTTEAILEMSSSDLVLLSAVPSADGDSLLALRGGPNLTLGVRVAKALSGAAENTITLFHAADSRYDAPDLEIVMRGEPKISRVVTSVSGFSAGIAREAHGHSAVVMGAAFRRPEAGESTESVIERVSRHITIPMALVRAAHPEATAFHAPYIQTSDEDASRRVDRWFAENTFHSREFADLDSLLALKEKRGETISLGLPALNEEETVEQVIMTLKRALMDDAPLLDEIVLIDSNSTDNTVAIAESCGIPVHRHPDILPHMGSRIGKGEALWKSLGVLTGDIVAWVDTDITNIHPRFVYGLIGPLLRHPHLQYVKGFYQRPIKVDDKLQAYGGGRVTELVARPMLNLFYPELSGVVQPLSGEYAGRRTALEQVPFFTGYGVETGLLIDLLERFGLNSIAQVDLEVRVHHNQPLVGLSKMSFAILQVFIDRLTDRYNVALLDQVNRSMKLIIQEPERFALEVNAITDEERPPMVTVKGS
jgi:glucosyl-3-phosphoglycerate synthase